MRLAGLLILLGLAACAHERPYFAIGLLGTAPARSPLGGPAPGSCTTTADCGQGYFCGADRTCYGPTYLPPADRPLPPPPPPKR